MRDEIIYYYIYIIIIDTEFHEWINLCENWLCVAFKPWPIKRANRVKQLRTLHLIYERLDNAFLMNC